MEERERNFYIDCGDGFIVIQESDLSNCTFNLVQLIVYQLYLSKATVTKKATYSSIEDYFSNLRYIRWVEALIAITGDKSMK